MAVELVGTYATVGGNFENTSTLAWTTANFGTFLPGDVVLFSFQYNSTTPPGTTQPTISVNGATGWTFTKVGNTITLQASRYQAVYYVIITDTLINYAFAVTVQAGGPATGAGAWLTATVWRGVDTTTVMDATAVETGSLSGTSHACTGITTVTDGAMVVACAGQANDGSSPDTPIATAIDNGFTLHANWGSSQGNDASNMHSYKRIGTAGASGTTTITTGSVAGACHMVALRPKATPRLVSSAFVSRSQTMAVPIGAPSAWTATILDPDAVTKPGPLIAQTDDICVAILFDNATGLGLYSAPGSPWTQVIASDLGTQVLQVYWAPWTSGLTWPAYSVSAGYRNTGALGLILRTVDPTNVIDAVSSHTSSSGATVTLAAVTPATANAILLRLGFVQDDVYVTGSPSLGELLWLPHQTDATLSQASNAETMVAVLEKHTAGAGFSSGTATLAVHASATWQVATIAFGFAPPISSLVTTADSGDAVVDTTLSQFYDGAYVVSTVDLTAEVETTLVSRPPRLHPKRTTVWVHDLLGNRIGGIQ